MTEARERLYHLLPAVYRIRDAEHGEPLRALLAVLERELQRIEDDIGGLYDNWFIETCQEWAVPYIGDLLGVRGLVPVRSGVFSQRAYVANTLAYRRRKGTAAVLEQLARDITGWPARAVEFFELLTTTQYLNHVRSGKGGAADLRDSNWLGLLGGAFERTAHTAEVRHIDNGRGRYNIPNLGLFLWRLQGYAITGGTARAAADPGDGRYTFSPLGLSAPLFNRPRSETEISHLADEENVPGPLRRRPLFDELEARRQALVDGTAPGPVYLADPPVLRIVVDGVPTPPEQMDVCHLGDPPAGGPPLPEGWQRPPAAKAYTPSGGGPAQSLPITVAVDPALGRLAFPAGVTPGRVEVSYVHGFSGDLGGGPYDRRESLLAALTRPVTWQIGVTQEAPPGDPDLVATLTQAVQAWNGQPTGTVGVIAILDSRTYVENLSGLAAVQIPPQSQLVLVAADWPQEDDPVVPGLKRRVPGRLAPDGLRPHLRGDLSVRGTAPADHVAPGDLVIDGLLIEGRLTVEAGNLGSLRLAHATIAPGLGALEVASAPGQQNQRLSLSLVRSICGALAAADTVRAVRIEESIVDGGSGAAIGAPDTTVLASTVFGEARARTLEAGNSIFTHRVTAERRQVGCVRFCYLPLDSQAPRRYRCQPADAVAAARVTPQFATAVYGQPGYAQLAASCPVEISAGAEDENEMGAFHFLQQQPRVKNLRASLPEYLRFGLEAGIFFAT